jgi:hypothetical protein
LWPLHNSVFWGVLNRQVERGRLDAILILFRHDIVLRKLGCLLVHNLLETWLPWQLYEPLSILVVARVGFGCGVNFYLLCWFNQFGSIRRRGIEFWSFLG